MHMIHIWRIATVQHVTRSFTSVKNKELLKSHTVFRVLKRNVEIVTKIVFDVIVFFWSNDAVEYEIKLK